MLAETEKREREKVREEGAGEGAKPEKPKPELPKVARRYAASLTLDADRPSRNMGRTAEEVLAHLSTLPKAKLSITVDIVTDVPDGVPEDVQRIVLENSSALKFRSQGFEAT
jgi:hypothetical protein